MKRINSEESSGWKPTMKDAQELSEKLKSFSAKVVNGRKQYPFELYLAAEKIISFDDHGYMQVINPFQYHRQTEINALREWKDQKDMEQIFAEYPEEKVAYDKKIAEITKAGRELLTHFKEKTIGERLKKV